MMKKILVLTLIFQSCFLWAQQDQLYGRVDYEAVRNNANLSKKSSTTLIFTPSYSVYFDTEVLFPKDEVSIQIEKNKAKGVHLSSGVTDVLYTKLKKNSIVNQKSIYFPEKRKLLGRILTEEIPDIQWTIIDEFKKINDLKAQKATGHFRGRDYTVWFTREIPVPFGPWKLSGLPGLILSAVDAKGDGAFYVKSIQIPFEFTSEMQQELSLNQDLKKLTLKKFIKGRRERKREKTKIRKARMGNRETFTITTYKPISREDNYEDLFKDKS